MREKSTKSFRNPDLGKTEIQKNDFDTLLGKDLKMSLAKDLENSFGNGRQNDLGVLSSDFQTVEASLQLLAQCLIQERLSKFSK